MDENTVTKTSLAWPLSNSYRKNQDCLLTRRELDDDNDEDDVDGIRSILEAALGLTSLGSTPPTEPAWKKPEAITTETKPTATTVAATRIGVPPPSFCRHRRNNPMPPSSRGIEITQPRKHRRLLSCYATTAHAPMPSSRRVFPHRPDISNPPPSSSRTSSYVSEDDLALPPKPKRQNIDRQSRTTRLEQPQQNLPTPYNCNGNNIPHDVSIDCFNGIHAHWQQQQQLKPLHQSFKESSDSKPRQRQYQNIPGGILPAFRPSHFREPTKPRPKRKQPQQQQSLCLQLQPLSFERSISSPERQQNPSSHAPPTPHNSEDYLPMSMASRKMAETMSMVARGNNISPETTSTVSSNASDVDYLRQLTLPTAFSNNCYPSTTRNTTQNGRMISTTSSGHKTATSCMATLRTNNRHLLARNRQMAQRILESHEEIMMMGTRRVIQVQW